MKRLREPLTKFQQPLGGESNKRQKVDWRAQMSETDSEDDDMGDEPLVLGTSDEEEDEVQYLFCCT